MTWSLPLQCRDAGWLRALARGRLVPDAHQLGVGKLNAEIAKAALEFIKIEQPIAISAGSPRSVSKRMRWAGTACGCKVFAKQGGVCVHLGCTHSSQQIQNTNEPVYTREGAAQLFSLGHQALLAHIS